MRKILLLILLNTHLYAMADIRSVHCPIGCPSLAIPNNDVAFNHTYALSNNPETKFADWAAYEVNVLNFGDSPGRKWLNDPLIDDNETLEEADYKSSHKIIQTDKGHQVPLASFAGHQHWSELNYMSNITPQKSALNQGPWKDLESSVRQVVAFRKSLYVITGTLYLHAEEGLPKADEKHIIPSAYFKVVYDINGNSASFVFDQDLPRTADFCNQATTYSELKKLIPYSMPNLHDSKSILQRLQC